MSFSWKRAIGASSAKGKLSRKIGIPLTRSGRQRAMGRALGCSVVVFLALGSMGITIFFLGLFVPSIPHLLKHVPMVNIVSINDHPPGKFSSVTERDLSHSRSYH